MRCKKLTLWHVNFTSICCYTKRKRQNTSFCVNYDYSYITYAGIWVPEHTEPPLLSPNSQAQATLAQGVWTYGHINTAQTQGHRTQAIRTHRHLAQTHQPVPCRDALSLAPKMQAALLASRCYKRGGTSQLLPWPVSPYPNPGIHPLPWDTGVPAEVALPFNSCLCSSLRAHITARASVRGLTPPSHTPQDHPCLKMPRGGRSDQEASIAVCLREVAGERNHQLPPTLIPI